MYEIPRNLNKYSEEFVPILGWDFKQSVYALTVIVFFGPSIFFLEFSLFYKVFFGSLVTLFFGVAIHFDFDRKIMSLINYLVSFREISYFDDKMNDFIPIISIKNSTAIDKNKNKFAIIKIIPLDFSILSKTEQSVIVGKYRNFLKGISFPIQILCRTSKTNLSNWKQNTLDRVKTEKKRVIKFIDWAEKTIESRNSKTKFFYVVIPSSKKDKLSDLEIKCGYVIEKLKQIGLKAYRLSNDELISLYSAYFNEFKEVNENYLSPITLKKWN